MNFGYFCHILANSLKFMDIKCCKCVIYLFTLLLAEVIRRLWPLGDAWAVSGNWRLLSLFPVLGMHILSSPTLAASFKDEILRKQGIVKTIWMVHVTEQLRLYETFKILMVGVEIYSSGGCPRQMLYASSFAY